MAKGGNSTPEGAAKARAHRKEAPSVKLLAGGLKEHTDKNGVVTVRDAKGRIVRADPALPKQGDLTKKGGRPKGSKNIVPKLLKEMLLNCDQLGVDELERQIQDPSLSAAERREAIFMAWSFRHGKPRQQVELSGPDNQPLPPGSQTLIIAGGSPEEFMSAMRAARGEED